MTILEMLQQSAVLTILGMAIVFSFLWIMIVCINMAGKLFLLTDRGATEHDAKTAASVPPEHIAAIAAAVTEYRKVKKELL